MYTSKGCQTCRYNDWKFDSMNCQMCRGHNQWTSKYIEYELIEMNEDEYEAWDELWDDYNDNNHN